MTKQDILNLVSFHGLKKPELRGPRYNQPLSNAIASLYGWIVKNKITPGTVAF